MEYLQSAVAAVIDDPQTRWIALIVAVALFTRAAIGFGDGIIAVPLMSLMMNLSEAVPLILFISTLMSMVSLWKNRQHIQLTSLKRTAIMALLGFPLGILLLGISDDQLVKSLLGVLLIALSAWYFLPTKKIELKASGWSYLFGLLAGVLGGAYAFRGIVFSIYASLRGWSPAQFKGTIHSFYLVSSVLLPIGYFGAGLVTQRVIGLFLLMLPIALVATLLGNWSSDRLDDHSFQRLIWLVLLLLGVFFVGQYLVGWPG